MKIKIGVFFGGKSVEHEVSVISAMQAIAALNKEKYHPIPIYIAKDGVMYTGEKMDDIEFYKQLDSNLKKADKITLISDGGKTTIIKTESKLFSKTKLDIIDVAFPVVHGTNAEDGSLQGFLELLGVPYVGCDVLSSALGMDKYIAKILLKDNGIPVLDCVCFDAIQFENKKEELLKEIYSLGLPVIIKPSNLGSSVGIKKAETLESVYDAVNEAFLFAPRVLVEHAVENLREINCSVLGDYQKAGASLCEEPVINDDILSYSDKYLTGNKSSKGMQSTKRLLPAPIPKEQEEKIKQLAIKTFQTLGCSGVARIDFLMNDKSGEIWVNEINTIPGSLSFYLWEPLGITFDLLCEQLINLALKRAREKNKLNFTFQTNLLQNINFKGKK